MDNNNISCIEFLIIIYNWILYDIDEQNQQQRPVYIEMQPMTSRIYPTTCNDPEIPIYSKHQAPLIRQRKYVCSDSPEFPVNHTTSFVEPDIDIDIEVKNPEGAGAAGAEAITTTAITEGAASADVFESDFLIIEISDLNKED
jgi:hypothetical protein